MNWTPEVGDRVEVDGSKRGTVIALQGQVIIRYDDYSFGAVQDERRLSFVNDTLEIALDMLGLGQA